MGQDALIRIRMKCCNSHFYSNDGLEYFLGAPAVKTLLSRGFLGSSAVGIICRAGDQAQSLVWEEDPS